MTGSNASVPRARRALIMVWAAMCLCAGSLLVVAPTPVDAQTPSPPGPIPSTQLGGPGPCGQSRISEPNPSHAGKTVWVVRPTGTATPPRTGGTCNGPNRPVVFIAHGFIDCNSGIVSNPDFYGHLVENLVSNGHIVVYANYCGLVNDFAPGGGLTPYDQVRDGFIHAGDDPDLNARMNLADIGIWGHSYGGGMSPWLGERLVDEGWGSHSLWIAPYAPYYAMWGGSPFDLPSHTRSLHVIYEHDDFCFQGWCITDQASYDIYTRMPQTDDRQWAVEVNSDCRAVTDCTAPSAEDRYADHYTPATVDDTAADGFIRAQTFLKYYGSYRNLQGLSGCARTGTGCDPLCNPGCNFDITSMGRWSDDVAARPATWWQP